jgi:hypothetical protein
VTDIFMVLLRPSIRYLEYITALHTHPVAAQKTDAVCFFPRNTGSTYHFHALVPVLNHRNKIDTKIIVTAGII